MRTLTWQRRLAYTTVSLLLVAFIGVPGLALYTGAALPDAAEAMATDAMVQVDASRWLVFRPLPRPPGSTRLGLRPSPARLPGQGTR
ncbi:MAG: hypothetical protein EBT47_10100 [Chloroflexi bacterium]|nr:hypothetical protein [Chloroflexota bacterium]